MPDRSLRRQPLPLGPLVSGSPRGVRHGAPHLREYRPAPPQERQQDTPEGAQGAPGQEGPADGSRGPEPARGSRGQEDNPFAPPPEGAPDQPWRPRRPGSGPGDDSGSDDRDGRRSPWGQWSDQQPRRTPGGGFGEQPRRQGGPEGPSGQGGSGMRWDPTDPAQRRARYALLSGMWAFFFSLFGWRDLALLLGALALYWSISALRARPRRTDPAALSGAAAQRPGGGGGSAARSGGRSGSRPQTTAAVSGLVTASLALAMVVTTFTAQLVYSDYYACVNDALTSSAKHSCDRLLPEQLRTILGEDS